MRSILIALLMTFATQAGAWIYDDNFALRNTMQMAVSIRDSARGGCWTNLRESREYAEEKLRISGAKVRDKTDFKPNASLGSYYFEIYVHARRENKNGTGGCQGTIGLCQNKPPCLTASWKLTSVTCPILYPSATLKPVLRSSSLR